ncbi:DUF2179 domain-containing protein [Streptococcus ruminicola]|jgi:uncharacterized membrane-anchored protein YitT (DUF2179 family)|uniref:DUF2179 domain-containing protein n=1 Tax=Streptococcus ruminicola TaxID=2686210 RepID=A0A6G8HZR2_9STRE|nr:MULTISPECIES: YitT family protein [Streptococcus]QGZ28107.1 DUF2179 domain-containing protein [Streptococcus ruminicola]QIM46349.1 DUF2179 domain-containing protein [Streptococcus ruminicola]
MKKRLIDFGLVTIGAFIAAVGFNCFFLENHIASGGVVGLAVSLKALFGWNPGNFVMITNVPLLLACLLFLGKETFLKTIYGAWIYSIFVKVTENLPNLTHNPLLAAIFGAIICGSGLGIVFWGNSSTGGTGIITQILHKYTPLPLAVAMTIVDGCSVAMGFIAFDPDTVMYSIIALLVIGYVVNSIQTGVTSSRNLMIISPKNDLIKNYISTEADRGVTEIPVTGGFSGDHQTMLMTTVSRQEVPRLEKNIQKIDEAAFIVVMPATQVMGRGFSLKKYYKLNEKDAILPM